MKKNIYGIIDSRSGNFGDICILDRDEEFRDGCLSLFRNPDIPDYVISDLLAFRYGSIIYDSDMLYPKFDIPKAPTLVLAGADVIALRTQDASEEESVS